MTDVRPPGAFYGSDAALTSFAPFGNLHTLSALTGFVFVLWQLVRTWLSMTGNWDAYPVGVDVILMYSLGGVMAVFLLVAHVFGADGYYASFSQRVKTNVVFYGVSILVYFALIIVSEHNFAVVSSNGGDWLDNTSIDFNDAKTRSWWQSLNAGLFGTGMVVLMNTVSALVALWAPEKSVNAAFVPVGGP